MAKLTLVVPTYTADVTLESMAYDCIRTYKQQGANIVVCEDGQLKSKWLLDLADSYIYNKDNAGFTKNVNRGWKYALANGADYVGIVNSDTYWVSGKLDDLCIEGSITSPVIANQEFPIKQLRGSFFVVPKEISDKYGFLDEKYKTYCSDQEYEDRTKCFKEVESVRVFHLMSRSFKFYNDGEKDHSIDLKKYEE